MKCSLCQHESPDSYIPKYFKCPKCHLIIQDPKTYLSKDEESYRYQQHNNDCDDPRYINYLSQITDPLLKKINSESKGLDFGCGPGPTISKILNTHNIHCENYDPLFFPEETLLEKKYDFIVSTEVFEHLHGPKEVIEKLWTLLNPGGMLAVMTVFYPKSEVDFEKWWYKNDPTHVCFYNPLVFEYIALELNADLEVFGDKIAFLTKR